MSSRRFVDFKAVKASVSILQAAQFLGLEVKREGSRQCRAQCPVCKDEEKRALALEVSENSFYCHSQKTGGDVIALVAHVNQSTNRDAAEMLQDHFLSDSAKAHSAPSPTRKVEPDGGGELQALDYLVHEHPVADMLGLSAATLKALGGGYASKGMMAGRIAIPLRMDDGRLVGYFGIATKEDQQPLLKFPDNLEERCTAAPKQEAVEKPQPDQLRKLFRVV